MSNRQFWSCKDQQELPELMYISPYALLVFAGLSVYCHERAYPAPILTSIARTKEEEIEAGSESDTHITLRAFDISSLPYTRAQIDDIIAYMTKAYGKYGAMSATGEVRLVIYHKVAGGAFHFHFQVHRRYAMSAWKGLPNG